MRTSAVRREILRRFRKIYCMWQLKERVESWRKPLMRSRWRLRVTSKPRGPCGTSRSVSSFSQRARSSKTDRRSSSPRREIVGENARIWSAIVPSAQVTLVLKMWYVPAVNFPSRRLRFPGTKSIAASLCLLAGGLLLFPLPSLLAQVQQPVWTSREKSAKIPYIGRWKNVRMKPPAH